MKIAFRIADSWLLYAIGLSSQTGPATLSDVIAAADVVNHAIMTFEEFDSALAKLLVKAHVRIVRRRFLLRAKTRRVFDASILRKRDLMAQWDATSEFLGAAKGPYDPRWKDPLWRNSIVTRDNFDDAVGEYLGRFRSTSKKKKKKQAKRPTG
jgi:hypothetical protein